MTDSVLCALCYLDWDANLLPEAGSFSCFQIRQKPILSMWPPAERIKQTWDLLSKPASFQGKLGSLSDSISEVCDSILVFSLKSHCRAARFTHFPRNTPSEGWARSQCNKDKAVCAAHHMTELLQSYLSWTWSPRVLLCGLPVCCLWDWYLLWLPWSLSWTSEQVYIMANCCD